MIICSLGVNSIFIPLNLSSPGAKGFVNLFKGSLKFFSLRIFNANESPFCRRDSTDLSFATAILKPGGEKLA